MSQLKELDMPDVLGEFMEACNFPMSSPSELRGGNHTSFVQWYEFYPPFLERLRSSLEEWDGANNFKKKFTFCIKCIIAPFIPSGIVWPDRKTVGELRAFLENPLSVYRYRLYKHIQAIGRIFLAHTLVVQKVRIQGLQLMESENTTLLRLQSVIEREIEAMVKAVEYYNFCELEKSFTAKDPDLIFSAEPLQEAFASLANMIRENPHNIEEAMKHLRGEQALLEVEEALSCIPVSRFASISPPA